MPEPPLTWPAATGLIVSALADPALSLEIEATVVLADREGTGR
jgi:hypothetical protein